MTMTDLPVSMSRPSRPSSCSTWARCRLVVASSRMYTPTFSGVASLSRCRSPPDSVVDAASRLPSGPGCVMNSANVQLLLADSAPSAWVPGVAKAADGRDEKPASAVK
jgi:hypothetical protein